MRCGFSTRGARPRHDLERIAYAREPRKLPVVLSADEVVSVLGDPEPHGVDDGLRRRLGVSEVAFLKVPDIDNRRMLIRLEQGKRRQGALRHALATASKDSAGLLAADPTDTLAVFRSRWRAAA